MAKNDTALFEEFVNGDSIAEGILSSFSKKQIHIVSPSVSGLLESFTFKNKNSLGIEACGSGFESDLVNGESVDTNIASTLGGADNNENDSSKTLDFSESISDFLEKVKNIRSSFLPSLLLSGSALSGEGAMQQMESYENTFMRMLGMPDDIDIKNGGGDSASLIFYVDPSEGGYSGRLRAASLAEITGENKNDSTQNASILLERQKISSGDGTDQSRSGRKYNFTSTVPQFLNMYELAEVFSSLTLDDDISTETNLSVNYCEPNDLMKFFYLKSVPIQDSRIYGCISEPSKMVSKPFDTNSGMKISGQKIHTSLLETIIRIRLDKISGAPGIYSSDMEKINNITTAGLIAAENVGDKITQVECFLIEKLKKVLMHLSDQHIRDTVSIHEEIAAEEVERNTDGKSSGTAANPNLSDPDSQAKYKSTLDNLRILKAKEDAILFLLKDTSSSSGIGNNGTLFSSLDLQIGSIRTASGFQDILSGPLLSLISQRSIYLGKKIDELNTIIEAAAASKTKPNDIVERADLNSKRGDKVTFEYLGVSAEDFLIYLLAFLAIDQDYLIGLLSKERRLKMANTISLSVFTQSSSRDPYGLFARIEKSESDGGFPSVKDSVNALSLLVYSLYVKYIELIKLDTGPREEILLNMWKEYVSKESEE